MKILIAEDEETIAMVFQVMLEHSEHKVTLARDGEECVKAYKDAVTKLPNKSEEYLSQNPPFDVVLMDGRMPKMDGIQAAKLILDMNKHQRIIFVTAYTRSTVQNSLKEFSTDVQVLTKPVELEDLLEIIESGNRPLPLLK